ncbi:hypothetical protein [uncultured Roseibium sp.]|uniref:hypothetical protein n=1 Tax=uncultured Roseibium sp. TaxID=1936171 RepID=UPI00260D2981|nr:hypothetical protein [uncultured Roseibium sp.]
MPAKNGNKYAQKWPTSELRQKFCQVYCDHISAGYSKKSFPHADLKTIKSYAKRYPEDFPSEKIGEAERRGLLCWEQIGKLGTLGRLPGFKAISWIFNMKNRAGWHNNQSRDLGAGETR